MESKVTLDAGALRPHLLRWFAVESDHAAGAASLYRDGGRQARTHHLRAAAIAALLDQIGWTANGSSGTVMIDALAHGWAASEALQALIAGEEHRIAGAVSVGEEEAAGTAMGRRRAAKRALTEVEEVSERIGVSIEPPC